MEQEISFDIALQEILPYCNFNALPADVATNFKAKYAEMLISLGNKPKCTINWTNMSAKAIPEMIQILQICKFLDDLSLDNKKWLAFGVSVKEFFRPSLSLLKNVLFSDNDFNKLCPFFANENLKNEVLNTIRLKVNLMKAHFKLRLDDKKDLFDARIAKENAEKIAALPEPLKVFCDLPKNKVQVHRCLFQKTVTNTLSEDVIYKYSVVMVAIVIYINTFGEAVPKIYSTTFNVPTEQMEESILKKLFEQERTSWAKEIRNVNLAELLKMPIPKEFNAVFKSEDL